MKYQELAYEIKKDIGAGVYHESDKLPTEEKLAEQYKVSKYCVRNAVNILTRLGLVYPVQGSGMYIREQRREDCLTLQDTNGLTEELTGDTINTKVIHLEIIAADDIIAARMKCNPGTPLYYIIRARSRNGIPLSVEYTYYNQEIIPVIDQQIAEGSLFRYIRKELGLNISFADKILRSDKLSEETAALLDLQAGDPAMVIEDEAYLSSGQMYNASVVYYNYKTARFFELTEIRDLS
ncbi:MAG: GntR family transcriptional regulator [Hespellia sp.]|nr:GntR family transcriptional regulator [Hespellia sp.]